MKRTLLIVVSTALLGAGPARAGTDSIITQVSESSLPYILGIAGLMVIWFLAGAGLAYARNRDYKEALTSLVGPLLGAGVVGLAPVIGAQVGALIGALAPF